MKILKLTNNISIKVYDDEVEKVLNAVKEKDTIVQLKNGVFNTSYFVAIANEGELEDNKNQKEGMLHDGTPVIRHFGSWYLDGDFDDKGTPRRRIDSEYYPEVRRDCVFSRQQFNQIEHLSRKKRLEIILGKSNQRLLISNKGLQKIDNILKETKRIK